MTPEKCRRRGQLGERTMQAENWAVKALENYCDLIAEYDRKNQRFFIHHDASKPEDTGRWLPVEDVRTRF